MRDDKKMSFSAQNNGGISHYFFYEYLVRKNFSGKHPCGTEPFFRALFRGLILRYEAQCSGWRNGGGLEVDRLPPLISQRKNGDEQERRLGFYSTL